MIFSHIVQERLGQVILWAGTPSTGCYLLSEVFWQDPVNQYFSRQRNRWEKWVLLLNIFTRMLPFYCRSNSFTWSWMVGKCCQEYQTSHPRQQCSPS